MEGFKKVLTEEINIRISDMKEQRRGMGNMYDCNSYGAGYDEGELAGLRLALSMWEIFHDESAKDPQPLQDYPLEGQDG